MSNLGLLMFKSFILISSLGLAACTTPMTNHHYSSSETRMLAEVSFGKIIHMSDVTLNGSNNGLGATSGGAIGGLAGSLNGIGATNIASVIGGGLLGTVLGSKTEEVISRKKGLELIIQLEGGRTIAVVQEVSETVYKLGQRVRVMTMGATTRVTPDETTLVMPPQS